MVIDLKSNSISGFWFSTTLLLPDDVVRRIRELSPADKDGDSIFQEEQEAPNGKLIVFAVVSRVGKSDNKFSIHLSYHPRRRARSAKKSTKTMPSVSNLLGVLSALQEETKFECRLISQFKKTSKAIPILKLPLKLTDFPGSVFGEIHGIHFVSRNGTDLTHTILDTSPDGTLLESIDFSYSKQFHQSIAEEILGRAIELSNLYVAKE